MNMSKAFENIPDHLKPKKAETEKLFENEFLERLSRVHIAIPITMHSLIVAFFIYITWNRVYEGVPGVNFTIPGYLGLFLGGWFTWTFVEYLLHRWLFHIKTENKVLKSIQYAGHGIHHQYPRDSTRLAMTPLPALVMIILFFSFFWLIMQNYTFAFFPGFLFGYIVYIALHYLEHCIKPPQFDPFHRLWKWHALHHYKYPESKAFGVSSSLWDYVLGTRPKE